MTDEAFHQRLRHYLEGTGTPEEDRQIEAFYQKNTEKELFDDYSAEEEQRVSRQLKQQLVTNLHTPLPLKRRGVPAWVWGLVLLLLAVLGWLYFT